jgi:hypothetical protein
MNHEVFVTTVTGVDIPGRQCCSLVFGPCCLHLPDDVGVGVAGSHQWRGRICGALRRARQAHHLRPNAAFDSMDITTFSKITEVLTASFNDPTPDSFWLQVSIRHLYPIFLRRIARKFTFYPAASAQSLPCPARDIQRREPVFETLRHV